MTKPIEIFISYRSLDAAKVDAICARLRTVKNPDGTPRYRVWQDKHDIIEGSDWWQSIMEAIEKCDVVVFMMSQEAVRSEVCKTELRHAGACNRPILPLVLPGEFEYLQTGGRHVPYMAEVPDIIKTRKAHFLFYEGDGFLALVERGIGEFMAEPGRWRFTPPLTRPLDPNATTERSNDVIAIYDEACDYAYRMEFDRAVSLFQRVIQLDDPELADDAHGWASLLSEYRKLTELYARESTRHRAEVRWGAYVQGFPKPFTRVVFDPRGLAAQIGGGAVGREPLAPQSPPFLWKRGSKQPRTPKPTEPPLRPDPVQEALTRARNFIRDGKKNRDWTPFIAPLSDLKSGDVKIPDMRFCLVPTGKFMMGSDDNYDDEKPVHEQTFHQPFYIAQYPVTNAQWALAVKTKVVAEPEGEDALKWYKDPKMANSPVVGVKWFSCQKFAAWAVCHLPTECEWEYAARGIESLQYPWGNDWDADKLVWKENSEDKPNDVMSKPNSASWVGALHLSGNVWEWTASLYEPYPYVGDGSRERDADARRVLRGGSWIRDQDPARVAYRNHFFPYARYNNFGFRLLLRFPSLGV
ncbi:MAG: SUMF1/EgtB/PvdO family nonheme iron enzyme [Anaerolineae bacterium]|jgi:formylglycine-generating enzyme required for sulfatase activity|nr:SUMF1/EgtB/PvdO family nonheme iron enzyme [Anaerolineae bacterium]